ncbi:MAG: GNAT family N-acetyltransferase [Candidatus Dadabacteria bacterium]
MKNNSISIATSTDVPQLVNLVNSAYRGERSRKGWTSEADLLDGIRTDIEAMEEMLQLKNAVILKYVDESQKIAGCVYLQKEREKLYLGMLTVNPTIQGKGIGKKLLQSSENYAKENDCSSIIMTVISVREELIRWYESKGYYNTGEKKPFPDDPRFGIPKQPLQFIVMKKDL